MVIFPRDRPPRVVFLTALISLVTKGPALIVGLSVAGGGADAVVNVYDGVNANGERKISVYAANKSTESPNISHGIMCETGIYVALTAVTDLTTLMYYPGEYVDITEPLS
jgi:hypothetical protein